VAVSATFVALACCGWYAAALPPFGVASSAVTFFVAAVVLATGAALARVRPHGPATAVRVRDSSLLRLGASAWLIAVGLALAVELWEFAHSPRNLYPTLSSLANDVVGPGHRVARATAFACWGVCGLMIMSRPRPGV